MEVQVFDLKELAGTCERGADSGRTVGEYPWPILRHSLDDLHCLRWKLAPHVVTLLLARML
ncbi:hypothetical protein D3C80_1217970 [compost metagenome]